MRKLEERRQIIKDIKLHFFGLLESLLKLIKNLFPFFSQKSNLTECFHCKSKEFGTISGQKYCKKCGTVF